MGFKGLFFNGRKRYKKYKKSKLLATKAYVDREVAAAAENKFVQLVPTASFTGLTATMAAPLLLNALSRGNTNSTRIGDRVRIRKIHINLKFYVTATMGAIVGMVRPYLIQYKNPRGVAPSATGSDVFDQANPGLSSTFNDQIDWHSRFKVIHDFGHHAIWPQYSAQLPEIMLSFTKNLKFISDYSLGNAGTIADIDKNAIYLYIVADNPASTLNCEVAYKIYYKDM